VLSENELIIFGGANMDSCTSNSWGDGQLFGDCHILNVQTWEWSRIKGRGDPPSARAYHSSAIINSLGRKYLYFVGGDTGSDNSDIVILDLEMNHWKRPFYQYDHDLIMQGLVVISSKLCVFGGLSLFSGLSKECFLLNTGMYNLSIDWI